MKLALKIVLSAISFLLTLLLVITPLIEEIDLSVSDQLLRLRGKHTVTDQAPASQDSSATRASQVAVVAIDESSYRELNVPFGPPWPRALHAKLLKRLKDLGAKRVVFDVLFVGQGPDPQADEDLAQALKEIPTVIGVESTVRYVSSQGGGYTIEEIELPYEPFKKSSQLALVGLRDREGIIRNFPLPRSEQEQRYPFLSQAAAGIRRESGMGQPGPRDMIHYYGAGRSLPIYSYWELLQDDLPIETEVFKDAIIFVGILLRSDTGAAQKDSYQTPFGGSMMHGVEVHATITANLLANDWIKRPSAVIEACWQATLVAVATFLGLSHSLLLLAVGAGIIAISWLFLALFGCYQGFYLCGATTCLLLIPAIVLITAIYAYLKAKKSEEGLRSAFSLYVSPEMIPQLGKDPSSLKLGGEKLWLTALFTDIEDFTSISEDMPAEKTSEMLNAYFSEVMDVIFKNQGTLLKFIGDAVFAVWGAPIKLDNHAEMAIKTAIAIQKEVHRFNQSDRFPPLKTRIGIHTGPMLVGNLGSKRRFDYTAIGDSVNLSARIEGINKYFGTEILFSENTRKDAGGFAGAVLVGSVRVKGRRESVRLYTIFTPPLSPEALQTWDSALQQFSAANFEDAAQTFVAAGHSDLRLSTATNLYQSEIERWINCDSPPPQGWSGELDFEGK